MSDFELNLDIEKIVENKVLKENIKKIIKNKKFFHAYVFCGERGTGRFFISKVLSNRILNHDNKIINLYSHDLFIIEKEIIGVEDIRLIFKNAYLKPYYCDHKVFILKSNNFTVQAQNAFLKILEEPPKHIVFILIIENLNFFLKTIISRCIIFKTELIKKNIIEFFLKSNFKINKDQARIYASYSCGCIGKSIELINNQNFFYEREIIFDILKKILFIDSQESILFMDNLEKFLIDDLLKIIYFFIYDIVMLKETMDINKIINIDKLDEIMYLKDKLELQKLLFILDQLIKYIKYLNYRVNNKLILSNLLIDLAKIN